MRPVGLRLVLRQVDAVLCKTNDLAVIDMFAGHKGFFLDLHQAARRRAATQDPDMGPIPNQVSGQAVGALLIRPSPLDLDADSIRSADTDRRLHARPEAARSARAQGRFLLASVGSCIKLTLAYSLRKKNQSVNCSSVAAGSRTSSRSLATTGFTSNVSASNRIADSRWCAGKIGVPITPRDARTVASAAWTRGLGIKSTPIA